MPGAPKELNYLKDQMIDRWVEIYEDYDLYWIPDNGICADHLYRPKPTHNSNPYDILNVTGYNIWACQIILDEFSEFFDYYKRPRDKACKILVGEDKSLSVDSLHKIQKLKEKIVSVRTERLTWIKDWANKHINNLDELHKVGEFDIFDMDEKQLKKIIAHIEKDYKKTFVPKLEFKIIQPTLFFKKTKPSVLDDYEWEDKSFTINRFGDCCEQYQRDNGLNIESFYEIIQLTKSKDVYIEEQEQQETVDLLERQDEADSWDNETEDDNEHWTTETIHHENGNVTFNIDIDIQKMIERARG